MKRFSSWFALSAGAALAAGFAGCSGTGGSGVPVQPIRPTPFASTPSTVVSVPCPLGTLPPTGASQWRRPDATTTPGPAPVLVQWAEGVQYAVLPHPVTAGNTLVTIEGFVPASGFPSSASYTGTFNNFSAADDSDIGVTTSDVPTSPPTQNIGQVFTNNSDGPCVGTIWIGEFSGTSSSVIQAANAGTTGTQTTNSGFVPNAVNGLVISAYIDENTAAAAANPGFTSYFVVTPSTTPGGLPFTSEDVRLAQSATVQGPSSSTPNSTTAFTLTYSATSGGDPETTIFQIPPANFVGAAAVRRESNLQTNVKAKR